MLSFKLFISFSLSFLVYFLFSCLSFFLYFTFTSFWFKVCLVDFSSSSFLNLIVRNLVIFHFSYVLFFHVFPSFLTTLISSSVLRFFGRDTTGCFQNGTPIYSNFVVYLVVCKEKTVFVRI